MTRAVFRRRVRRAAARREPVFVCARAAKSLLRNNVAFTQQMIFFLVVGGLLLALAWAWKKQQVRLWCRARRLISAHTICVLCVLLLLLLFVGLSRSLALFLSKTSFVLGFCRLSLFVDDSSSRSCARNANNNNSLDRTSRQLLARRFLSLAALSSLARTRLACCTRATASSATGERSFLLLSLLLRAEAQNRASTQLHLLVGRLQDDVDDRSGRARRLLSCQRRPSLAQRSVPVHGAGLWQGKQARWLALVALALLFLFSLFFWILDFLPDRYWLAIFVEKTDSL